MKLTNKQELFIEHYLANGGNGTQAARSAGYKGSDLTLRSIAKENLTKPHVLRLIQNVQTEIKQKLRASAEDKRAILWQIVQGCMLLVNNNANQEMVKNAKTAILAIAELNKMDGDLAALNIKAEVSVVDHVRILEQARMRAKKCKVIPINIRSIKDKPEE